MSFDMLVLTDKNSDQADLARFLNYSPSALR